MREANRGAGVRAAVPHLLGLCALALMLVPQLALHDGYRLAVRAALAGLIAYLAAARSARQAVLFALMIGAVAWLLDLEEGAMIALFAAAGIILALAVGRGPGPLPLRVPLGCLIGACVLVAGMAAMMLWRKESGLLKALQFGLAGEWPTTLAALLGASAGAWAASRTPR